MSDEEDYMSGSFLNVAEDIRPGLTFSKSVKRKHDLEKRQVERQKIQKATSVKVLEAESRKTGMDSAIGSDNKGFALMQKMGYKPGMKLGTQKEESSDRGLIEPIKVTIKPDRGGLGRDAEIRSKIEQREKMRHRIKTYKEEATARLTEEFRTRMRDGAMNRRIRSDLGKIQRICEQLDKSDAVEEPMRRWFWFTQEDNEDIDEEEEEEEEEYEEEISLQEQVDFVAEYIRSKYVYCFWCGVKYCSEDDMLSNCPGPEKDSHDSLD